MASKTYSTSSFTQGYLYQLFDCDPQTADVLKKIVTQSIFFIKFLSLQSMRVKYFLYES